MSRLIDRGELFNRLANVKTVGEVFEVIQEMPTAETKTVYYWHEDLQRRGRPHKVIEVEDE